MKKTITTISQIFGLSVLTTSAAFAQGNEFNPKISLILDGAYAHYSQTPGDYKLPGFALSGEAGLSNDGFHVGESELQIESNVDQVFRAQANLSFNESQVSVEQAFAQTIGLSHGLTFKLGRFFSDTGYLNPQHTHAWQFADAPLIYRGLFGDQFAIDGLQATWLAPTDQYLLLGTEASNGSSTGNHAIYNGFVKWGDDIGNNASWQLGAAYISANKISDRKANDFSYLGNTYSPSFSGKSHIATVNAVYKWAPNGNFLNQNLTLQAEYFSRDETGVQSVTNAGTTTSADNYQGNQSGWYAHGRYQFTSEWTVALRYDQLSSTAKSANNPNVLRQAGLVSDGFTPSRSSVSLGWKPSEFSRIRLQYNDDHSQRQADQQVFVQYTYALGTHGAHTY